MPGLKANISHAALFILTIFGWKISITLEFHKSGEQPVGFLEFSKTQPIQKV